MKLALMLLFLLSSLGLASEGAPRPLQILSEQDLKSYRSVIPQVKDKQLEALLNDPETIWYDSTAIPRAYQDSIPGDIGVFRNDAFKPLNLVGKIFDVYDFNFPFRTTGGLHMSYTAHV